MPNIIIFGYPVGRPFCQNIPHTINRVNMITLIVLILILIAVFRYYSRYLELVEGIDPNRKTPALTMTDGVDYVPMPWWRIFLVQFRNIAGLGPIFGAVAGAMWGPVAYLRIILGSVFAGAVHDYFSGRSSHPPIFTLFHVLLKENQFRKCH